MFLRQEGPLRELKRQRVFLQRPETSNQLIIFSVLIKKRIEDKKMTFREFEGKEHLVIEIDEHCSRKVFPIV